MKNNEVVVKFGADIPGDVQGVALLDFERRLRALMPGTRIEVFKETKADDSKLRNLMTPEQRAKL
jgi:hypothetical protein